MSFLIMSFVFVFAFMATLLGMFVGYNLFNSVHQGTGSLIVGILACLAVCALIYVAMVIVGYSLIAFVWIGL